MVLSVYVMYVWWLPRIYHMDHALSHSFTPFVDLETDEKHLKRHVRSDARYQP